MLFIKLVYTLTPRLNQGRRSETFERAEFLTYIGYSRKSVKICI